MAVNSVIHCTGPCAGSTCINVVPSIQMFGATPAGAEVSVEVAVMSASALPGVLRFRGPKGSGTPDLVGGATAAMSEGG